MGGIFLLRSVVQCRGCPVFIYRLPSCCFAWMDFWLQGRGPIHTCLFLFVIGWFKSTVKSWRFLWRLRLPMLFCLYVLFHCIRRQQRMYWLYFRVIYFLHCCRHSRRCAETKNFLAVFAFNAASFSGDDTKDFPFYFVFPSWGKVCIGVPPPTCNKCWLVFNRFPVAPILSPTYNER